MKSRKSFATRFLILLCIFSLAFMTVGCENDEDEGNLIRVCNGDNKEYRVKLFDADNHEIMGQFTLEKWYYLADTCSEFDDVPDGPYYLAIYRDNGQDPTDVSGTFYVEDYEYEGFHIDSTGDIERD